MIDSRKLLFVSIFFLSSTAAHCMFDDTNKLFLVHASKVMSINNTKIAGAQQHLRDGSPSFVEAEGTNLRKRMTYHNCINGMVPDTSIGKVVSSGIAVPSNLHTSEDICAYIDPLSAFQGEVFGGKPDDFMIIDGHTYGKFSMIIVPHHKQEEFREKNPHYEGTLIIYDPHSIPLRDMVEEVISKIPGAPPFSEINDRKNREDYVTFCKKHQYSHRAHGATPFMLLEYALKKFHQTIDFINRERDTIPLLPADQVKPLSLVIEVTLDHIQTKLSSRLSEEKNKIVNAWVMDTKNWLELFKFDAKLRLKESKSIFKNQLKLENIQDIIRQRKDQTLLAKTADHLPSIHAVTYDTPSLHYSIPGSCYLGTGKSKLPFPENSIEEIHRLPLHSIQHLRDLLIQEGYEEHADEISLVYLMNHFKSNNENKKQHILNYGKELFANLLNNLTPSDHIRKRLEEWVWSALSQDKSFRNQSTIFLLNTTGGRDLRQKMWGESSTLNFWTLLQMNPKTSILFRDLENEDFGFGTEIHLSLAYKRFTQIIRQWLLEKATNNSVYIPGCKAIVHEFPQSETMTQELKNPYCSLFNMKYAEKIATKISLYTMDLHKNIFNPDNSLNDLIRHGCFTSWGDLLGQIYDLSELNENDLLTLLNQDLYTTSMMNIGVRIKSYLSQCQNEQERFEYYKPIYEALAQQIATAGERPIEIDPLWGQGLDWYIKELLDQCINGITQEVGKNKVTILPNWEQAKLLYDKLCGLANSEERLQLDTMMEPVFRELNFSDRIGQ